MMIPVLNLLIRWTFVTWKVLFPRKKLYQISDNIPEETAFVHALRKQRSARPIYEINSDGSEEEYNSDRYN